MKSSDGTSALSGVQDLTAATGYTCAHLSNGDVDCWGNNSNGQLGNGTKTNSALPVTVA